MLMMGRYKMPTLSYQHLFFLYFSDFSFAC
jgi:hypothetical protein